MKKKKNNQSKLFFYSSIKKTKTLDILEKFINKREGRINKKQIKKELYAASIIMINKQSGLFLRFSYKKKKTNNNNYKRSSHARSVCSRMGKKMW